MRAMTEFERGWVIGFLEGEGSFDGGKRFQVKASQVQREPLERLCKYTGLGKVYGPYT